MKRIALALALALVPALAYGEEYIPPQFDKPFQGRIEIHYTKNRHVKALCDRLGAALGYEPLPKGRYMGCALGGVLDPNMTRHGIIVIGTDWDVAGTYRHERAHLNGWRHD